MVMKQSIRHCMAVKCHRLTLSTANREHVIFILLINAKMPTTVGILAFMSRINFMLSSVEHENICNLEHSFFTLNSTGAKDSSCT